MKIACWSGPRNISTALMRSWSSRKDTFVSDEPFYAFYLKKSRKKHPMYKEIISSYPNSFTKVLNSITKKIPQSKSIWYQKHMAHHLFDLEKLNWVENFHNCILLRDPISVINSYTVKNRLNDILELGFLQQYKLINYLQKKDIDFVVIDSNKLIENPEKILKKWCFKLGIEFDNSMLSWENKIYSTDGIWAKHWYDSVIKTNRFIKSNNKNKKVINEMYQDIYFECQEYYQNMIKLSL